MAMAKLPPPVLGPLGVGPFLTTPRDSVARDSTSSAETLKINEVASKGEIHDERHIKQGSKRLSLLRKHRSPHGVDSHEKTTLGSRQDAYVDHSAAAPLNGPPVRNDRPPSRAKTFWRAFHNLCSLDEHEVEAFMDSYVIYSLDWNDEAAMRSTLGDNFQQRVGECLRAYYGVLNHLCALGDVEKMYIPPLMDRRLSVRDNQLRYEESVAHDIGLRPGMRVLDLGCGRGRVAAHMTTHSGAVVTGLNIDPNQVAQARSYNEERGLPNTFVEHDFNTLPLPLADASLDGFYQIQALSLCRDHDMLFRDLHRVLRPGARLSILDWVSLPAYDPARHPEHAELMRRVKPLIGAVGTPTPRGLEESLRAAGFRVLRSDNASVGGLQAPLIGTVDFYFRSLRRVLLGLVGLKVLPSHLKLLINRLCLDGEAFVKMDTMRLITTSWRIIAEKPLHDGPGGE